jgi:hypothetical protein
MIVMITLGIVFIAGVLVGMGVMVCLGIAREESRQSLRREPPGPAAAATRVLVGLHARPPKNTLQTDAWASPADGPGSWRPPAA